MSTFYPQNDYRGYLSHHGIKGQKWGEQNGPPYPLSNKIHNMVVRGKQKRAAKRREKILHDPRKLAKHQTEFTKEEIDSAIAKIKSVNEAKALAGKSRMEKIKDNAKAKSQDKAKQKTVKKFNKKISKYSTIEKLDRYKDRLSEQEIKAALARIGQNQEIFDAKIKKADRPRQVIQEGSDYLKTAVSLLKNAKSLKDTVKTPKFDDYTFKEKHRDWLIEQGKLHLLDVNDLKSYSESKKVKDNKAIAELREIKSDLEKQLSEAKNKAEENGAYFTIDKIDDILTEYDYNIVDFAADKKVKDISNELVNDYDYMLQMGYLDPNRVYHSDPEIDWSIFSDVKMSDINDMFS